MVLKSQLKLLIYVFYIFSFMSELLDTHWIGTAKWVEFSEVSGCDSILLFQYTSVVDLVCFENTILLVFS